MSIMDRMSAMSALAALSLSIMLLGAASAGAQVQIVPGYRTVVPGSALTTGVPVIVRPQPAPDVQARQRQIRNQITRDRIGARYERPQVPGAVQTPDGSGRIGRPDLDPARAGDFARGGPTAIGRSAVTRPALTPRR